jgi:hypothetical protein
MFAAAGAASYHTGHIGSLGNSMLNALVPVNFSRSRLALGGNISSFASGSM